MARIFVVDDQPVLLDLISRTLYLDGHEVTVMTDPAEARDAIIDASLPVDLLLIEVDMQPLSGFQLVAGLRSEGIACQIIFMSGHHGLAGMISESVEHQVVIEKPFTALALRASIRNALAAQQCNSPNAV